MSTARAARDGSQTPPATRNCVVVRPPRPPSPLAPRGGRGPGRGAPGAFANQKNRRAQNDLGRQSSGLLRPRTASKMAELFVAENEDVDTCIQIAAGACNEAQALQCDLLFREVSRRSRRNLGRRGAPWVTAHSLLNAHVRRPSPAAVRLGTTSSAGTARLITREEPRGHPQRAGPKQTRRRPSSNWRAAVMVHDGALRAQPSISPPPFSLPPLTYEI